MVGTPIIRTAEKDQFFDARRWATVVLAERSAYEKIFELTSGTKDTMKTVYDTLLRLLHVVGGFDHPTNLYFAEQMIERIELSTNAYSLDDVLTKIVDHYNPRNKLDLLSVNHKALGKVTEKTAKRKVINYQWQFQQSAMAMLVQLRVRYAV